VSPVQTLTVRTVNKTSSNIEKFATNVTKECSLMDSTVNQMYIVKQVLIELKKLKLKTVDKSNIHMITVCLVKEKEFQSVNLTVVAKV